MKLLMMNSLLIGCDIMLTIAALRDIGIYLNIDHSVVILLILLVFLLVKEILEDIIEILEEK